MRYEKFIWQWKHKLVDSVLFVARQSGKQDKATFTRCDLSCTIRFLAYVIE
jgi:hypothetical protein